VHFVQTHVAIGVLRNAGIFVVCQGGVLEQVQCRRAEISQLKEH
jgi:hypothetical protein